MFSQYLNDKIQANRERVQAQEMAKAVRSGRQKSLRKLKKSDSVGSLDSKDGLLSPEEVAIIKQKSKSVFCARVCN